MGGRDAQHAQALDDGDGAGPDPCGPPPCGPPPSAPLPPAGGMAMGGPPPPSSAPSAPPLPLSATKEFHGFAAQPVFGFPAQREQVDWEKYLDLWSATSYRWEVVARELSRLRDQPFDYYERANAELNLIADGAQWDNGAMGTVHFGDEYISARLCEDDYAQEFTLGDQNVAWRAKMPAQFGELCFGTRRCDGKEIRLRYWKPSPYSNEELRILHKVFVDDVPLDPQIIDKRWGNGVAYNPNDEKFRKWRTARVRAKHGFFPPFQCYGPECDRIWNNEDSELYFNGGLLLMGHGKDPNYEKHFDMYYAQSKLQEQLTPGGSHKIRVEVHVQVLARPETVGMIPQETFEQIGEYVRDPYIMFANRRSGRTQRNVTGDGMIPLPITRCLARGEFILHVPKQFVASGLLPRFPYGLNAIKEGPIVDIEKAMQSALRSFVQDHQDYQHETFLWCNVIATTTDMEKTDFSEDDIWQIVQVRRGEGVPVTTAASCTGLAYFYRRKGNRWKDDESHCSAGIVPAKFTFIGHGDKKALPLTVWGHSGFGGNVPTDILTAQDIEMTGFKP